jgi:ParB/Sulfiredoxin domain
MIREADWENIPPSGRTGELNVDDLHLDFENPRLPANQQFSGDENALLRYIADTYNAIEVAESIARHGFFVSEPLIVIRENGRIIVVEGNRRLAALRILRDPSLAKGLVDEKQFVEEAKRGAAPSVVPVVLARDRQAVSSLVGYRHISGIEPWDAFSQARFIAQQVDGNNHLSFDDVAANVGERWSDVAAKYRNYAILRQARDDFELDTERAVKSFGVFTRAMTALGLREYIGAPAPSEVDPRRPPLSAARQAELQHLLQWLFGTKTKPAVIGESRDITALSRVVASEDGRAVLISTNNLPEADAAAGGPRDRLLKRLENARSNLGAALQDIETYAKDDQVLDLINQCSAAVARLMEYDARDNQS